MWSVNVPNGFWPQFSYLSNVGCGCSLFIGRVVAWQAEDPEFEAQHKAKQKQKQNKSCSGGGSHDSGQKGRRSYTLFAISQCFCVLPVAGPSMSNKKTWSLSSWHRNNLEFGAQGGADNWMAEWLEPFHPWRSHPRKLPSTVQNVCYLPWAWRPLPGVMAPWMLGVPSPGACVGVLITRGHTCGAHQIPCDTRVILLLKFTILTSRLFSSDVLVNCNWCPNFRSQVDSASALCLLPWAYILCKFPDPVFAQKEIGNLHESVCSLQRSFLDLTRQVW